MRLPAGLFLTLSLLALGCERYRYEQMRGAGGVRTVRIDRYTGRTEMLEAGPRGVAVWREVPADLPAATPTEPPEEILPPEQARLVEVGDLRVFLPTYTSRLGTPVQELNPRIELTVRNGSTWEVTEITAVIDGRVYHLQHTPGRLVSGTAYPLEPGGTENFQAPLDNAFRRGAEMVDVQIRGRRKS